MRYFEYLSEEQKNRIFLVPPAESIQDFDRETLSHALGATLYMPANIPDIADKLTKNKIVGLISTVLCLEDAVGDMEIEHAEKNLITQAKLLLETREQKGGSNFPFIFIRVRNLEQMKRLVKTLGPALSVLTGFVFPKFNAEEGRQYFEELSQINSTLGKRLYGMPILEDPEIIRLETREAELFKIKEVLNDYKDLVLNIRIGATDLSGLFGIRRNYEFTIYDVAVIRDCIADIVNVFGRPEDGFVISGPVWEYFSPGPRILKPQLRQSPFEGQFGTSGLQLRQRLICKYVDGLIKEVILDKVNGLVGKTIIHPSHLAPVQALYAVTHEEYLDALAVLSNSNGGVQKSDYNNKMNEMKPHMNWAKKIMTMAKIYGVLNDRHDYTSIIYARERLQNIGQPFSQHKN